MLTVKTRRIVVAADNLASLVEMNNSTVLLAICSYYRKKSPVLFRNFHSVQVLSHQQLPNIYPDNAYFDRSLFYTNLPNKRREKQVKKILPRMPTGTLLIKCKNRGLDHYSGVHYGKFDVVPLASKGWAHRKSVGDYFTILPTEKYSPFSSQEELPQTFEDCGIRKEITEELKKINVTQPTAIQAKSIERLLRGENLVIFAESGSGKTLGYIIAMIENILKWRDKIKVERLNAPLGIIVTNSRELNLQVMQLVSTLSSRYELYSHALLDGYLDNLLENPIRAPVDILVCNVKTMEKHLRDNIYSLEYCKHVVVDDADVFDVEHPFNYLRSFFNRSKLKYTGLDTEEFDNNNAQICFVSSVAPSSLQGRINDLIQMSEVPTVSTPFLHRVLHTVEQKFIRVNNQTLLTHLLKICRVSADRGIPTIVFSDRNTTCNWASHFLMENGVKCASVNKSKNPGEQVETVRSFKAGDINVLCATNSYARGLHFPKLKHVVNLDFPPFMVQYIHRCGRVGRLGQAPNCLITNFIRDKPEILLVQRIEKAVRMNTPLPSIVCPKFI